MRGLVSERYSGRSATGGSSARSCSVTLRALGGAVRPDRSTRSPGSPASGEIIDADDLRDPAGVGRAPLAGMRLPGLGGRPGWSATSPRSVAAAPDVGVQHEGAPARGVLARG